MMALDVVRIHIRRAQPPQPRLVKSKRRKKGKGKGEKGKGERKKNGGGKEHDGGLLSVFSSHWAGADGKR